MKHTEYKKELMKDNPLTATEIRENWECKHDKDCRCELCYCRVVIKARSDAILEPLIKRTQELLNGRQA